MVVKVVDITNMSESELVDLLTWASENLFNVAVGAVVIDAAATGSTNGLRRDIVAV